MASRSLSHWDNIVEESNNGFDIWVGVDVHKNSYSVAILSANGVIHSYRTSSDNQALLQQFRDRGIKITVLVYEAGLTGFGLARACQQAGVEVMVVSANKIPRAPLRGAKTDSIDCMNLALLAAKGMLRPIAIPSVEQELKRAQVRRRMQLAKSIRVVKLRIKSLFICHGIAEPTGLKYWGKQGREQLTTMPMPELLRDLLDSHLGELNFLEQEKAGLENKIKQLMLPAEDVLQTVPGIGPIISAAFRAEVFSPERFANAGQVSSFLGLSPCLHQSGESKGHARLMAAGQANLRSLLIEACWILKKREKWASDFYQRIVKRSGCFQRAITGLARKLCILLWRLLLTNCAYQSNYQGAVAV